MQWNGGLHEQRASQKSVAQNSDVAEFFAMWMWMWMLDIRVCVGVCGWGGRKRKRPLNGGRFSGMKSLDDRWGKRGDQATFPLAFFFF